MAYEPPALKLSELIKVMVDQLAEHGDLPVHMMHPCGGPDPAYYNPQQVYFIESGNFIISV